MDRLDSKKKKKITSTIKSTITTLKKKLLKSRDISKTPDE